MARTKSAHMTQAERASPTAAATAAATDASRQRQGIPSGLPGLQSTLLRSQCCPLVLKNTCFNTKGQHPFHRSRPAEYQPNRQSATVITEERGWRGTTSRRTTTRAAPELIQPKPAYAGDTVLRDVRGQLQVFLNTSSRGIFDRCFSTPLHYPSSTLALTCGANQAS
jgi:hypothetical protein